MHCTTEGWCNNGPTGRLTYSSRALHTLIRYTWWGIAQRADIFSSSSIPPLFPAGRLIGFAATRYRGLVSSSIFHPHIYFTLHWLASGTENCLICSSKFGGEGAQMLVVWGQQVPLGACSCRSPPPESCHTQRLPMPITPYLANNHRPPAPSNHRHCFCWNIWSQTWNCPSFCRDTDTKNFPKY